MAQLYLRRSQMPLLTKIGLGVFLCLSLFMLVYSITRAAGMYYQGTLDVPWGVFWLHAEACVGVLMASITVYRSVLIGPTNASGSFRRFVDKIIQKRTSEGNSGSGQHAMPARVSWFLLAKIPNATLTGLATLLGPPNQETATQKESLAIDPTRDVEEVDYHDHLRQTRSMETSRAFEEAERRQ